MAVEKAAKALSFVSSGVRHKQTAPTVSVLMSVYNGTCFLRESIESILAQSFEDFEFVIVDDGSTDRSWDVLSAYAEEDPRILLTRNNENIGLTRSLNKALALACGEYIARQDADDVSLPNRLEKQVFFLDKNPDFVLVSGEIEFVDAESRVTGRSWRACDPLLVQWFLLFGNYVGGHSQVMYRRELVLAEGGYDEEYRYSQDYELWTRLIERGDFCILPDVLLRYRTTGEAIGSRHKQEQRELVLKVVSRNIRSVIGGHVEGALVEQLSDFWERRFFCLSSPARINRILRKLRKAYVRRNAGRVESAYRLAREIGRCVSRQYIRWSDSMCIRSSTFKKASLWGCALAWHWRHAVAHWIGEAKGNLRKTDQTKDGIH